MVHTPPLPSCEDPAAPNLQPMQKRRVSLGPPGSERAVGEGDEVSMLGFDGMEGMSWDALCEEHPGAGRRGQREAQGKESISASAPPWQAAGICPGSCRMLGTGSGLLVSRSDLFPHLSSCQELSSPAPQDCFYLAGRQLPSFNLLLQAHGSLSTQRPGHWGTAGPAPAVPVLAAQALCVEMHLCACSSFCMCTHRLMLPQHP